MLANRDYSIVVYSQQNIDILDEEGNNHMLHFDG
jgi:hypothetical protein